jgi:hypothetical protein
MKLVAFSCICFCLSAVGFRLSPFVLCLSAFAFRLLPFGFCLSAFGFRLSALSYLGAYSRIPIAFRLVFHLQIFTFAHFHIGFLPIAHCLPTCISFSHFHIITFANGSPFADCFYFSPLLFTKLLMINTTQLRHLF